MDDTLRAVIAEKGSVVHSIEPTMSVLDAVRTMDKHGIGALLITASGSPVGVFTERDVLKRVVDRALDPAKTLIAEVMTREIIAVGPMVSITDAMAIMTSRRCRHLPVVDAGRIVGMVSAGDLARWVSRGREADIQHLIDYITGRYPA
jgi:CBS domain-containing protein